MREITASKLSKILEEHKRWIDTDKKEGEKDRIVGGMNVGNHLLYKIGREDKNELPKLWFRESI